MWYSNDMFRYMFKAEFVTLVSLKVPSGSMVFLPHKTHVKEGSQVVEDFFLLIPDIWNRTRGARGGGGDCGKKKPN